jgi:hypothetical protein
MWLLLTPAGAVGALARPGATDQGGEVALAKNGDSARLRALAMMPAAFRGANLWVHDARKGPGRGRWHIRDGIASAKADAEADLDQRVQRAALLDAGPARVPELHISAASRSSRTTISTSGDFRGERRTMPDQRGMEVTMSSESYNRRGTSWQRHFSRRAGCLKTGPYQSVNLRVTSDSSNAIERNHMEHVHDLRGQGGPGRDPRFGPTMEAEAGIADGYNRLGVLPVGSGDDAGGDGASSTSGTTSLATTAATSAQTAYGVWRRWASSGAAAG